MDWLADLSKDSGERVVRTALAAVADAGPEEYVEAPQCQMAIAAAEAVAAARGRPSPSVPEALIGWAAQHRALSADLVPLAIGAIDRVTTVSELKELWEETDPEEWRASTGELRQRLG